MNIAACGDSTFAFKLKKLLPPNKFNIVNFVDFTGSAFKMEGGDIPVIDFIKFKSMFKRGEIAGILIVNDAGTKLTKEIVKICKLNSISLVGVIHNYPVPTDNYEDNIYWLNPDKIFIHYLETHIIDSCNLNCNRCVHFSPLYNDNDFYNVEIFKRDIRRISQVADVLTFRLLGGEPFIKSDFIDYVKISGQYLKKTNLRVITNGLLIPSAPQKLLDAFYENQVSMDISMYPPTLKIFDRIEETLNKNNIPFVKGPNVETFRTLITLNNNHNPVISMNYCGCTNSRFLRDGKVYKCPVDIMSKRYKETYKFKNFPESTGIDIFADNFPQLMDRLDDPVEHCFWCNENTPAKRYPWKASGQHTMEEWLA